ALLHIVDVPSGLACSCYCVGCERRMVAKKGAIQAHHFVHRSARDGRSCSSLAGETALHKFAKKVLDQKLEIALPEKFVSAEDDREARLRTKGVAAQAESRRGIGRIGALALLRSRAGGVVDAKFATRTRRKVTLGIHLRRRNARPVCGLPR